MKIYLKYYLFCLGLIVLVDINGQEESPRQEYFNSTITERKFDEEKWKELVKDFDYSEKIVEDYDEELDSLQTNPNANNNLIQSNRGSGFGSAFWAGLFQILFIVLVVVVIVVLLISMLGAGDIFAPRSRKFSASSNQFSIENIENNIHETDLDKFIREAVEEKNYALAIRLYYLAIIKELSLSRLIKWKRNKTNRSYLSEMYATNLYNPFKEATRIFERVWYGESKLDEREYLSIKPKFEQLVKAAQSKAPSIETD